VGTGATMDEGQMWACSEAAPGAIGDNGGRDVSSLPRLEMPVDRRRLSRDRAPPCEATGLPILPLRRTGLRSERRLAPLAGTPPASLPNQSRMRQRHAQLQSQRDGEGLPGWRTSRQDMLRIPRLMKNGTQSRQHRTPL
jgi:hypothetical protein